MVSRGIHANVMNWSKISVVSSSSMMDIGIDGAISKMFVSMRVESNCRVKEKEDSYEGFDSVSPLFIIKFSLFDEDLENAYVKSYSKTEHQGISTIASGKLDVNTVSGHEVSDDELSKSLKSSNGKPKSNGKNIVEPSLVPGVIDPVENQINDVTNADQHKVSVNNCHFWVHSHASAFALAISPGPEPSSDENTCICENSSRSPGSLEHTISTHTKI